MELGDRTWIMAVLNVTPDSFYPGSRARDVGDAASRAASMIQQGADILDIGGESTRPGAAPVPESEEMDRVLPVIEAVRKSSNIFLSVDTCKASVACEALRAGADLVNDITGFHDPGMPGTVADSDAAAVVMHIRGTPENMQQIPPSEDILGDTLYQLRESVEKGSRAGLARDKIIIDPGIGFGKTVEDNLNLLRRLDFFQPLDRPLLVGPSRKSFIGKILEQDVEDRLWGTAAAVTCGILSGAHIIRVHDVTEMKAVARMADALAEMEHD
jgi:dihydropteroate synthase